uniref:Uncharacterized protein n=1 Tax=Anguilla anguilla TaxID=7936 RepID=A0A0E9P821_ANGAN
MGLWIVDALNLSWGLSLTTY